VEVVLVVFRHKQQLNVCDRRFEFPYRRKDLEGIEVELWWKQNMQSNVIDNLEHDNHQLSYIFDNNLQLDEVVVVVGLEHMSMMVVVELEVLVEHIVVVVHMFVEAVELVVDHMMGHMLEVVVVEVVLVVFHRMQQLNVCDRMFVFQYRRRDLEGIGVEL
jgi:hypothetical protein